jgi:DNA-binding CsgD family transcriptional regulator
MFGDMQSAAPAAVLIDDAGWADTLSLQALTFALRRMDVDRVLAVLSVRSEDTYRLSRGLQQLTEETGSWISLSGLTVDDIVEFAAGLGHPATRGGARRLHAHTGGNPLHLKALFSEIGSELMRRDRLPAPQPLASLVARTLAAADPATSDLLTAAAVLGMRPRLSAVTQLADIKDPLEALEDAQRFELVDAVRHGDGWIVSFRHPLLRAAVYDGIGPATLARLHREAASVSDPEEALDHLVAVALRPDPGLVARLQQQAAVDEGAGRLGRAADRLLAAARLAPGGPQQVELVLDAVEKLLAAGEVADVTRIWPQIMAMPTTSRRRLIQAQLAWLTGHYDESALLAESVWRDDAPLATRAAAALMLAQIKVLADDGAEAGRWADLAVSVGGLPPALTRQARTHRAVGLALSGDPEAGVASYEDLPSEPSRVPRDRLDELWLRGSLRLWCDDLEGAFKDLHEQAADRAGRSLEPYGLIRLGYLAQTEYRWGAWNDSLSHAYEAETLIADTEQAWLQAFGHATPVFVLAARGLWDQVEAHLSASQRAADQLGDQASVNFAANSAVHASVCRFNPAAVVDAAAPLRSARGGAQVAGIFGWPTECASAFIALGQLAEAREVLDRVDSQAERRHLRSIRAAIAGVRAELHARQRRSSAARTAFETAELLWADQHQPFDLARSRLTYGMFLRRAGERREAVQRLRAAETTFRRLEAKPFLERCLIELAASGLTISRDDAERTEVHLTPQELAVARLVTAGRSNREAAAQLVLSAKTVGYHLGNIYSKYNVQSRTQLAAVFREP